MQKKQESFLIHGRVRTTQEKWKAYVLHTETRNRSQNSRDTRKLKIIRTNITYFIK